jgi:hypothetical protein
MPGNSAPPVLVDAPALPHQFSAFPPVRQKAPPVTLQQNQNQPVGPKPPPKAVFLNAVGAPMVPNTVMPKAAKPKPPVPPKCAADWLGGTLFQ